MSGAPIAGFIIWFVLVGWVANDAARRHRSPILWALLVGITGPLGLIPWLVIRRRLPADEQYAGTWQRVLLWSIAIPVVVTEVVIALFNVTFLFQMARVEGQAMAPTLENQDRLVVNKLAYRLGEPHRGDVVMHYYPINPTKSFVKRIIAREGDTVRIADGRVYINDAAIAEDFVPQEFRSHDDFGPHIVPQGYYFVMGDHRNNSSDSRHWGMVPRKYIVGRVAVRWWPLQRAHVF
jgi:signal peptidase I